MHSPIKQVVKVIWHKTASPLQMDGSIVFARWRQMCHPCGHIGATWRIWLNLCFLRPTQVHNLNGKLISKPFLHSSRQSVVRYVGATCRIRLKLCTLAPSVEYDWTRASFASTTQTANRLRHSSRTLQWADHPFPQNCPFPWGIWTPI